jgi:hypothetical protein
MTQETYCQENGGGSFLRNRVAEVPSENTSVFSAAFTLSTSVLRGENYASGTSATRSQIVLLSRKQTNRALAAAAVASYRPPHNENPLGGTLLYATLAGVCISTPPPTTPNDRGGTLLRIRSAHSQSPKQKVERYKSE